MQNYHPDLVWKLDLIVISIFLLLAFYIIFYLLIQERSARARKKKLLNIKNDIYEMLISGEDKNICLPVQARVSAQAFLDVVTNRNRSAAFFNEQEQAYFKKCFINQSNILKIETRARSSKNKWRRIEAILALGYSGASSALDIFEKGLFSKDEDISYFSMLALGQIKTTLSARILLAFLKKNTLMRLKVAALLEDFPPFAADEIIKLIEDKDPAVRFWAVKILSRFKPSKYIENIKKLVNDTSGNVRAAACECLGTIGGSEAEKILAKCLKDEFWLVRVYAAKALDNAMGPECVKYAASLLNDNSLNVVEAIKEVLIKNIEAAFPYLEKIIVGENALAIRMSVEILATSGYVEKLIRIILAEDNSQASVHINVLAALIRAGAHYSVEAAILNLNSYERAQVAEKIKAIDPVFAEHIMKKIEGEIKEI